MKKSWTEGWIKETFEKKLKMGILEELDEIETDVTHLAARLYRFNNPQHCINLWSKNAAIALYQAVKKRYDIFRTSPHV